MGDGVEIVVVVGPAVVADAGLLTSLAEATCAELGVPGRTVVARSVAEFAEVVSGEGLVVAVPGERSLSTPETAVRYDLGVEEPLPGSTHLYGRGVWGLGWAIRHAVHRHRNPAHRVFYGEGPEQWADVRLPAAVDAPVAVLLHGGFWRSIWAADLMDALAIDLAARGWASWNLEYRRPDRHGWDATVADVAAGVAAASGGPGPVVLFGHSAGGQLALRLAADHKRAAGREEAADRENVAGREKAADHKTVALAVSLAGVVDLVQGERRYLGEGAIPAALGGTPATVPDVYAASDPMARLPIGTPALLVQGGGDSPDLVDMNRRYAAAARAAGDDVTLLELPGDHFDVIKPGSPLWAATMSTVTTLISR
jgi:acetyl esterase/lipase